MGGQKPHLLVSVKNNLGAETYVQYAPSTKFYLVDKAAGNPWITRLPFPVHVVERVETYDCISRNRFVTRSAYHHGYFDGVEREFRGFGLVEQTDTEEFAALNDSGTLTDATNVDEASHVPPVLTKTWFHTGAYIEGGRISRHFQHQYYHEGDESEGVSGFSDEQLEAMLLPDTTLPNTIKRPDGTSLPWTLSTEEEREACRALKGSVLRREIYALDGTDEEDRAYSATEQNYTIEVLQPHAGQRHAVFFAHPRESVDFHYERKLFKVVGNTLVDPQTAPSTAKTVADPRVTHALTLEVDGYGNVLKSAAIGYGRRYDDPQLTIADQKRQTTTLVTYTESDVTNPIDDTTNDPDNYRAPLPSETRTFELLNSQPASDEPDITNLYRFDELGDLIAQASDGQHDILYEDVGAAGATGNAPFRRLIERVRTLYRSNTLSDFKPFGELESLALPGESYKLAFTPTLLSSVYRRQPDNQLPEILLPDPASVLGGKGGDQAGYVDLDNDGHWWIPSGRVFFDPDPNAAPLQELNEARQHFFLPHRFQDPFGNNTIVEYDKDSNGVEYDLLVVLTRDALDNEVRAQNDYRVLQPERVTDPNGNRAEVAFDALGMVAGTAVRGKTSETFGDNLDDFDADLTQMQLDGFYDVDDPHVPAPNLLKGATTRIVYDLDRFRRTQQAHPEDPTLWLPACASTLAREIHVSDPLPPDGLKIQISFSYSDGFGREIQQKIQAEPGPVIEDGPLVSPRWVGSGWTIFNNKGKPVRQYEPFFSQLPEKRHRFEFGVQVGVSPVLFYDAAERVVATLDPNHTWEKIVFDPWQQTTYDVNDTVLNADGSTDPKSDEDVKGFFLRLPDADYLPTWYGQRIALAATDPERVAADKAAVHRQTPTIAHFDTLGRTFLTVAHNRFERNDAIVEEKYPTRVELDIEGNQRAVRDAVVQNGDVQGRIVMRYDYDMLGNRIHQAGMEAGERWMLNDVTGKPIRAWDSRGHNFKTGYDSLRRPLHQFVRGTDSTRSDPRTLNVDVLFAKMEYGEGQPNDVALNLRARAFKAYDGAGVATNMGHNALTDKDEAYDFKGNLLRSRRQPAADYDAIPDWSASPALQPEVFTSTTYDALNRPTAVTAPDNSVYHPTYNDANLLDKVELSLRGAATPTPFVTNIDYNAKGQRTLIHYANGAETTYEYDQQTFRLIHLKTTRAPGQNGLASQIFKSAATVQDLRYTYDPTGNITHIEDAALLTIFHNNEQVEPVCDYTYDAIYRLIEAQGREHIGQTTIDLLDGNFRDYPFAGLGANSNDLQALRNYTEHYEYDAVGNFEKLIHEVAPNGSWTRGYVYNETSLLESTKQSNRLSTTTVGQTTEVYAYDIHGNMTAMPHLTLMQWDFKNQLRATSRQVDNNGTPETTFYVYDASGQRVRKVTERQNGTRKDERIYIGGFEVYRKYNGNGVEVTLERETLHVMDDTQRIALVETQTVDSASPLTPHTSLIRYQLGNHLGSASLELDEEGGLIFYEEYHPYGTTAYQAMNSASEVSLKRYRYTGKERDEQTGFYYHGARYYGPWLGRWISADPAGIADRTNLYDYVRGNPIGLVDPNGLAEDDVDDGTDFVPLVMLGGDPPAGAAPGHDVVPPVTPVFDATAPAKAQRKLEGLQQAATDAQASREAYHAELYEELHRDDPDKTPLPEGGNPLRGAAKEVWNQALGLSGLVTYVLQLTSPEAWESGPEARAALQAQMATIENRGEAFGAAAVVVGTMVLAPGGGAAEEGAAEAAAAPLAGAVTLPTRAKDIERFVGDYLRSGLTHEKDLAGVERIINGLTVGLAQPLEDPALRVVTFTDPRVHDLFAQGTLSLAEIEKSGETLVLGPRPILAARKALWHAEVGGALSLDALGAEGGYVGTSRNACTVRAGYLSCTQAFKATPNWIHMNPGY
jgi:RHS repeat-associated protein